MMPLLLNLKTLRILAFKKRLCHLLNVLCTLNLRLVSRGCMIFCLLEVYLDNISLVFRFLSNC